MILYAVDTVFIELPLCARCCARCHRDRGSFQFSTLHVNLAVGTAVHIPVVTIQERGQRRENLIRKIPGDSFLGDLKPTLKGESFGSSDRKSVCTGDSVCRGPEQACSGDRTAVMWRELSGLELKEKQVCGPLGT